MTGPNEDTQPKPGGFTRRSMITGSAGVATTMAVTALAPAALAASRSEAAAVPVPKPVTPIDGDPVVAYIHNAARGEVTVIHGEAERTYRDRALVKRLLAAAQSSKEAK